MKFDFRKKYKCERQRNRCLRGMKPNGAKTYAKDGNATKQSVQYFRESQAVIFYRPVIWSVYGDRSRYSYPCRKKKFISTSATRPSYYTAPKCHWS